jgi:hypothetical protein
VTATLIRANEEPDEISVHQEAVVLLDERLETHYVHAEPRLNQIEHAAFDAIAAETGWRGTGASASRACSTLWSTSASLNPSRGERRLPRVICPLNSVCSQLQRDLGA